MSNNTSSAVTTYRWIVFLLALGFWLYQFTRFPLDVFGWQFRYLTIWGLTANTLVAWMMLRYSLGRSDKTYNSFVSASVVLGLMVMFLYWKMYFTDPALLNVGGKPMPWYQEYYLHGVSQFLMMIDAFFILGVFKDLKRTFVTMMAIFIPYILWIEFLVQPLNSFPEGKVTSGFPYPFLNDMEFSQRLVFYATTIVTSVVFMFICWGIARLIARGQQQVSHG